MIFVIVAILILIFSFIIALASLIREQSKQVSSSGSKSLSADGYRQEIETTPSQIADLPNVQARLSSAEESLPDVTGDQGFGREPFLWEQGQEAGQDQAGEQSIAEAERKLAAYKLQKQQKVASENEDTSTKQAGKNQNLSGEFLLSDLK